MRWFSSDTYLADFIGALVIAVLAAIGAFVVLSEAVKVVLFAIFWLVWGSGSAG